MEAGEYAGLLNNGFCKICCLIKRRVAGMIAIEISGELRRLIDVMGSIMGLPLLLSGCGSGLQTSRHISQPPVPHTKEARQCLDALRQTGIRVTPLPDRAFGGDCRTLNREKLDDFGT